LTQPLSSNSAENATAVPAEEEKVSSAYVAWNSQPIVTDNDTIAEPSYRGVDVKNEAQSFEQNVSESLRAGLAKADVIRAGAKIRGRSSEALTENERCAAEILEQHYRTMLGELKSDVGNNSAPRHGESSLGAFGIGDFTPPATDAKILAGAADLLRKMSTLQIEPDEADRLLNLITEIQFGPRTAR
jgi:hypothetical protein